MGQNKPDIPFHSAVMPEAMQAETKIQFRCHKGISCFNACCRQADVTLAPYDILRLKRRLGLTSTEPDAKERYSLVKEEHCKGHEDPREIGPDPPISRYIDPRCASKSVEPALALPLGARRALKCDRLPEIETDTMGGAWNLDFAGLYPGCGMGQSSRPAECHSASPHRRGYAGVTGRSRQFAEREPDCLS